jgi:DMSO/TMAO reductase YedYZ heme-binding membrane subunit
MSVETKSNARTFLDYLYFSLCSVLVCFFIVYGATRWMGFGIDLDDNIMVSVGVVALSVILAACLKRRSIK